MTDNQIHFAGCPQPKPSPRVWMVNEYEFWAGSNLDELRRVYLETTGVEDGEDVFYDHYPCEVDMDLNTIKMDDGRTITFQERLEELIAEEAVFPRSFAVTADVA